MASGLKVLEAMLEEDRSAVCGPRYAHQPERQAYRAGHTPSQVVLGGRKVAIRRPRARRDGAEVPLPTARAFTDADPLNRRVVDQMLIGVATRQYARSLDPLGADITTRGTSKSAVSRRFVAQTQAQLDAWRATPLNPLDLAVLLIDGVQVGGHCIVVALGIDHTGAKHPLGLWEGATEKCDGLSGTFDESRESRAPHRPEPPGDRRWGEGPGHGRDPDVRPGRRGAALSGPQGPEHPGPSPRRAASMGDGDPQARLYTHERQGPRSACCRTWLVA